MSRSIKKEIEYFDRVAHKQDVSAFVKQRVLEKGKIIRRLIVRQHKFILDLGCGKGLFVPIFHKWTYIGVDISAESIKVAKNQFLRSNFLIADANNLPFKNSSIGAIFGNGIVHHVGLDVFKEVARVQKDGGTFVAFEPNQRNPIVARRQASIGETCLKKEEIKTTLQKFNLKYYIKAIHWIPYWWVGRKRKLFRFIELILERIPFIKEFGGSLLIYAHMQS